MLKDITYGSAKYQGNVDGIYAVREEITAYNNSTMGNHDVGRGLVLYNFLIAKFLCVRSSGVLLFIELTLTQV